eukprot:CAMPEP_0182521562 /NCGR_PEP_ID=MMETSP1321-20130603/46186_1 /TAXON_ID=91990 /ORGANISM="Bolidomonas sp., Strain RCC1657" /LENGTH=60 /DNA_ID=CAMNT_0024729591 /DNA_START=672 /DNA_END=854 /DNA_ORIENTATION=-
MIPPPSPTSTSSMTLYDPPQVLSVVVPKRPEDATTRHSSAHERAVVALRVCNNRVPGGRN